MGVQYYVACQKCGVMRDVDKFYAFNGITKRDEAMELISQDKPAFQAVLAASFLSLHEGHPCVLINDIGVEPDKYRMEELEFWK